MPDAVMHGRKAIIADEKPSSCIRDPEVCAVGRQRESVLLPSECLGGSGETLIGSARQSNGFSVSERVTNSSDHHHSVTDSPWGYADVRTRSMN